MADPAPSPGGSREGSSRHGPRVCFLPRSPAATPEMGEESHLTFGKQVSQERLCREALLWAAPASSQARERGHSGCKGAQEAEGLAKPRTQLPDVPSGSRLAPGELVGKHSSSPSPKHQGSAVLLHHSLLITLRKERPLLVPGPPGTATRRAGWPIKSSVGLVVPPHPSPLLGSSSWSVHTIPAALSVLALQRPVPIHLCSSPPPCLSFACSVPWSPTLASCSTRRREAAGQESSVNNCSNPSINRKIQQNKELTS